MLKILPAIAVCIILTIAGAIFLESSRPSNLEAMTEAESTVLFTMLRRVQNIEKQLNVDVPVEFKFTINCPPGWGDRCPKE
jgi:rRNA maturation endonuclease Nob1